MRSSATAVKQLHQGLDIGFPRIQHCVVHAGTLHQHFDFGLMPAGCGVKPLSPAQSRTVDECSAACFGIRCREPSEAGRLGLHVIDELKGHEVVLSRRALENIPESIVLEVADQEGNGPLFHDPPEMFEGVCDIRPPTFGLEVDDFPHDAQDVTSALLGRNEPLDPPILSLF